MSGHQLVSGKCSDKDRALTNWTRHGVTVIEFGEGESQMVPFTLVDVENSFYTKIANDSKCLQMSGQKMLNEESRNATGLFFEEGNCEMIGYRNNIFNQNKNGIETSLWLL